VEEIIEKHSGQIYYRTALFPSLVF